MQHVHARLNQEITEIFVGLLPGYRVSGTNSQTAYQELRGSQFSIASKTKKEPRNS